jgi:RES domain
MPPGCLPTGYLIGTAHVETLPVGTRLWRMHEAKYAAESFAPPRGDDIFGQANRFDGADPDAPYPFHYSAAHRLTALAETVLRDLPFDPLLAMRLVAHEAVRGRLLSAVETVRPLRLIRLVTAEDQAAVGQDKWLFEGAGAELIRVRRWAWQLRAAEPGAQGFVWASRQDQPRRAYVLFGDRCGSDPLKSAGAAPLDFERPADIDKANQILRRLRATIVPPGTS